MDTVKERIEKEAKKRVDAEYEIDYPVEEYYIKGFVHGATAERNKAIDDCINLVAHGISKGVPVDRIVELMVKSLKKN